MLIFFSSPPFYTSYVRLPNENDPTPPEILNNPKFHPFFEDALGAIDGTHINCTPSAEQRQAARDRKGALTTNCLAACTFDMRFTYIFSGWEGSAPDSTMWYDARITSLRIPAGKYYLADAGFPTCLALVIPIRGERYHLQEWGRAQLRPATKEELFNLRHACARNIIERIFGVLKKRFRILIIPPDYDMDLQSRLPPALASLHNFIRENDPFEILDYQEFKDRMDEASNFDHQHDVAQQEGALATSLPRPAEKVQTNSRRTQMATAMWRQYQEELARRREE